METTSIKSVGIIGAGNVGTHMARALHDSGISISFVLSRTEEAATLLAREVGALGSTSLARIHSNTRGIPQTDLILLCVPDAQIESAVLALKSEIQLLSSTDSKSDSLASSSLVIAHTSGSTACLELKSTGWSQGVFYPLQTFTRDVKMTYDQIPFFVEGSDPGVTARLISLAEKVSSRVFKADSRVLRRIHISAVFAANFSNHMVTLGERLLQQENIPVEVLNEVVNQTWRKIQSIGPEAGQTGPAIRNDQNTLQKHLEALEADPELKALYRMITESIQSKKSNE